MVTFRYDADGDGSAEASERWTDANGVATLEITVTGPLGTTWEFSAHWDGVLVTSSDAGVIEVVDTTPPEITSIAASPDVLPVPNHKLVEVQVLVTAVDACDPEPPECRITGIICNEADDGKGDGHTAADSVITGPLTAMLRAERSGKGTGRIYTITVECVDASGNAATATTFVTVRHDRGR